MKLYALIGMENGKAVVIAESMSQQTAALMAIEAVRAGYTGLMSITQEKLDEIYVRHEVTDTLYKLESAMRMGLMG